MKKMMVALVATSMLATPAQALVILSDTGTLTDTDATHNPRINRNGVQSTWAAPKAFPGEFGSGDFAYDSISVDFTANAFQDVYYQITYSNLDGNSNAQPHSTAYANLFNPLDLGQNYLGDSGSSPPALGTETYQVIVTAGNALVVNFSQNFIGNLPVDYSYTIEAFSDANGGEIFAVPEPATWAFMIFGFGAVGGALRRNRKTNVKVSFA